MSFCPWTPMTLEAHNYFVDLWLRWSLKQNCNPCRELSNNMWHATCTQVNQGNFRLLVVKSQIGTLTFGLSFGHNLCLVYSNETCKPILDIHVSRAFQTFQFNEFWPLQSLFENLEIQWDSNSQNGSPLGSVRVHSFTLLQSLKAWNVTFGLHSQLAPLQALALIASPRLGSQQIQYQSWFWFFFWKVNLLLCIMHVVHTNYTTFVRINNNFMDYKDKIQSKKWVMLIKNFT